MDEEEIHSVKKITRAGSGGFSIYLPKRWVNGWSEEQRQKRELEMFNVGDQLILTPLQGRRRRTMEIRGASREEWVYAVLSSYINGIDDFDLVHEGLSDEGKGEIRSILRFLDENLIVSTHDGTLSYENRPLVFHQVDSLLPLLFDEIIEAEKLAAEMLACCDSDRYHCVHLMHLLYAMEREDVNRLTLQIFRTLSRCRAPCRSFLDINYKWTSANMLEIMGDVLFGLVRIVCRSYGLDADELQYPIEYLTRRIDPQAKGVLQGMEPLRKRLVSGLEDSARILSRAKQAIVSGDGREAFDCKDILRKQLSEMEEEMAKSMDDYFSYGRRGSFLPVLMTTVRVREIMYLTKSLTKRAALIYFND